MKTMATLRRFEILSLAILALVLAAQSASAQSAAAGKFTLPNEVTWGQATLPAGDYSFTIGSVNGASMLALSSDTKPVALIMAQSHDAQSSGGNELIVKQGSVRELRLPDLGYTFFYPASKPARGSVEEERKMAEARIPIHTSGK